MNEIYDFFLEAYSNSPTFIIAELSANHNGSLETAKNTIKAANFGIELITPP